MNIHWPEVISNEELWRRAEETDISIQIKRRKWNWIGHTMRKGHDTIEREISNWNPQGQRKRGRPKQTWRRSVHNEALERERAGVKLSSWPEIGSDGNVLLKPYVPKGITGYDNDDIYNVDLAVHRIISFNIC
jgi:hypothetical protein